MANIFEQLKQASSTGNTLVNSEQLTQWANLALLIGVLFTSVSAVLQMFGITVGLSNEQLGQLAIYLVVIGGVGRVIVSKLTNAHPCLPRMGGTGNSSAPPSSDGAASDTGSGVGSCDGGEGGVDSTNNMGPR